MPISLLHLSDIHPRASENLSNLARDIASAVRKHGNLPQYIVASGDLGLKGKNQQESARFLLRLAADLSIEPARILCVPGNHDVDTSNLIAPFENYSRGLYAITGDSSMTAASSVALRTDGEIQFVLVNSAYHLDIAHGRVDCDQLRKLIPELSSEATKVVVVHHNAIPVNDDDRSTITNAYEFLAMVSSAGCDVVLHGHQHASLSLTVGKHTKLVGVGTVNFPPAMNVNNQFNVVEIGESVVRFRYHADTTDSRGFGNWDGEVLQW